MGAFDYWATDLDGKSKDLEYVRLLIGDTSTLPAAQLFSDRDLEVVCQREGDLKLAAAQLLDRIAAIPGIAPCATVNWSMIAMPSGSRSF